MHTSDNKRKALRVVFVVEEGKHFYYYQSVCRALCERGHRLWLFFGKRAEDEKILAPVKQFARLHPTTFQYGKAFYRANIWKSPTIRFRAIENYRRFLLLPRTPAFYARRLRKYLPWWIKLLVMLPACNLNFLIKTAFVGRLLQRIEERTPPEPQIITQLRELRPDVVAVSSGNLPSSSPDIEYIKAARFLDIPSAMIIMSWDYLSTKGIVHIIPDAVLVWNETLAKEAIEEHGISSGCVKITGAPMFDAWFSDLSPSGSRGEFCGRHRLDPQRPIVLYLGSSGIFGDETYFLKGLRETMDSSGDPRLGAAQIIVRPHPKNYGIYKGLSLRDTVLIPKKGGLPTAAESLQIFYDTLYFSNAVVGLGTTALIDAVVAGKPCLTMLLERYRYLQREGPHFRYLFENNVLSVTESLGEFADVLSRVLAGEDPKKAERERFIRTFIRPHRLERSAADAVADEIEALAKR